MSRRLPGATDSERLTLSTIKDSDQLTTRHNPGILDDVDLGTAKKILQATPVFACTSAAATAAKTAFLQDSFPDFELVNGRTIIVYMANANTAANPTLNVQYTDAIPLDGDYWQAGTFIKCQYVDITVNGNRIRRWVMDQGANNVKAQLNGALAQLKLMPDYSNKITTVNIVEGHISYLASQNCYVIITAKNSSGANVSMKINNLPINGYWGYGYSLDGNSQVSSSYGTLALFLSAGDTIYLNATEAGSMDVFGLK